MWRECLLIAAACVALGGCGGGAAPSGPAEPPTETSRELRLGQPVEYAPALPGPGFPLSEAALADMLARQDQAAMRRHAWSVWAALTAPTPSGFPVMLTWYGNPEIFGAGTIANPRLFLPQVLVGPPDNFGNGDPPSEINLYNQAYRDHVRGQGYQWRETLRDLVGRAADVADFPAEAIVVKTVWWPVRHDGLTTLPVWDEEPTRPTFWGTGVGALVDQGFFGPLTPEQQAELKSHERHGNEWGVFRRVVALDPTSTAAPGATAEVDFFDPEGLDYQTSVRREARVVPLNRLLTVRLRDAATVDRLNASVLGNLTQRFWGRPITREDSLALVAVHVTTRETPDWVWATFWWHDEPATGDRPAGLPAPFDQFRMSVTHSADVPLADDGGPHITYNPYLEAGFSRGTQSNCLGCHQRAAYTPEGTNHPMPVHRGTIPLDDPSFQGDLRTHFLWSLVFRPRSQAAATPPPPAGFVPDP